MRLYRTVRHLRWEQVLGRFLFVGRRKLRQCFRKAWPTAIPAKGVQQPYPCSLNFGPKREGHHFSFLNIDHEFQGAVDWNEKKHGRLWTYNLNYFEFLNPVDVTREDGLAWIHEYIQAMARGEIHDGWEPYPISLRLVFWIRFVLHHQIEDPIIDASLKAQFKALRSQLEFHLMGNHLLENGLACLFASVYFRDQKVFFGMAQLVQRELDEQILSDGAHFELSPMYHQIILYRSLDVLQLLRYSDWELTRALAASLTQKVEGMLSWLKMMSYNDEDFPMFNDASIGVAPSTGSLLKYAQFLSLEPKDVPLGASGYRRLELGRWLLFADVGAIGPDYIPGHAHADTLGFELALDGKRVLIDPGVSTYEKNSRRELERSTPLHNSVSINHCDSSEVWGGGSGLGLVQDARLIRKGSVLCQHIMMDMPQWAWRMLVLLSWVWTPCRFTMYSEVVKGSKVRLIFILIR